MDIQFSKIFRKQFRKLPAKHRKIFKEKLTLFKNDPFNPLLNNHSLRGEYKLCRSVNITGSMRAIYGFGLDKNLIIFLAIGTHSELYE
ncbi:type II toxin-antitoxin system mRNA interferase toxin, RelE/StbE family [Patescibacteria group bacterium]|nr:type II toxin-antitoxin system mRNA interferase toxin, RelE/StbE family [Patescibacteria group bacterium]MBU2633244.1 type II toxin-antitoxin system mRNA interferase toxin, RelE/StbE family [Patescibacteria group bacterium]